jgi:hypothetical protein
MSSREQNRDRRGPHAARSSRGLSRVALSLWLAAAMTSIAAASAFAQAPPTPTLGGTSSTLPFREFATRELNDPWDMSQRTDLGWFTWGNDLPGSNLTGRTIAADAYGNTYFSGQVAGTSADPSFFLLDTWAPGSAKLGKVGVNFPIDTTVYNVLYVKMKIAKDVLQRYPVAQTYWSRNTIYYDGAARPDGGTILAVDAAGNQNGIFLTPTTAQPYGSLEGGHWVIYRIPLTMAEMKAQFGSTVDHWHNVNGGADASWGAAGVKADSLRFSPMNLPNSVIGEMQVDWARLVSYAAGSATTVSWTGGGAYDVVVSTRSDCSDFAVLAYSVSSGYQLQPQILPPGVYRVGLRQPFTRTGQATAGGNTVSCSATAVTVRSYPALALTSPGDEGSTDDFATTFLGNAWDFDAVADVDYSRNLTFPDATYGIVSKAATDPAGNDLGTVRVFRNLSTDVGGGIGDPHIYPLWAIPSPPAPAGVRARGRVNHIDASRYRILTAEMGVERARDINQGSIARVIWHVSADVRPTGDLAETETSDIVLHHLDPSENGGKIVLEKVQADMADRRSLAVESDIPQSASGWKNTCTASAGFGCDTITAGPMPGIDIFRVDFHEFGPGTPSEVRRIKLAALERTGSSFQVRWTQSNPDGLTATVTLKAVPEANPAAEDYHPADGGCSAPSALTIASGLSLSSGSYTWTPGTTSGVVGGSEYFVCTQVMVSGVSGAVTEVMSRWPVVADTSFTGFAPTLQLDRATLRFAGVSTGQANPSLSSKTAAETIRFAQHGSGVVNWTASVVDNYGTPVNWLSVSPTSGTGSGAITVALRSDIPVPLCTAADALQANVKLTSPTIGNNPQFVQVYITIYPGAGLSLPGCVTAPGATAAAFGSVDTPLQGATGIQGAIGVTGWALDDVGVSKVSIYRNCLAFEGGAGCQSVAGQPMVYIGDAAFLAGARPDVEAAFPLYPTAYRAGWGYLMLTNMLPHVAGQRPNGGQGPLTLFAVATDVEGHLTLLGRSYLDHVPTSVTLANDSIAKPFGAIDTPSQGQTVSGWLANFGWVLTPDADQVAGSNDIRMAPNGSTMNVFIDGTSVGAVAYDQCRGSVGNPVPTGHYCDDDIGNIFGQPTPQPAFTVRTSNPTRYRNLDAGRGAIGAFDIDTTALSNGMHTLAWGVTDSAGRSEGIGSRFFNVINGAAGDVAVAGDRAGASSAVEAAPAPRGVNAARLAGLGVTAAQVWGRTSFNLQQPWQEVTPAADGRRYLRLAELGRLELAVPPQFTEGFLAVSDTLRPLPVGSRLQGGRFTWSPGPGYIGDYQLVFVSADEQVPFTVSIQPVQPERVTAYIDDPQPNSTVTGGFRVAGWAAELSAWTGSGIGAVHVWAQRRAAGALAVFVGAAELGLERPDVARAVGAQFGHAGWSLTTTTGLPAGTYDLTAYFWSERTARFEDARTVTVTVR